LRRATKKRGAILGVKPSLKENTSHRGESQALAGFKKRAEAREKRKKKKIAGILHAWDKRADILAGRPHPVSKKRIGRRLRGGTNSLTSGDANKSVKKREDLGVHLRIWEKPKICLRRPGNDKNSSGETTKPKQKTSHKRRPTSSTKIKMGE